MAVSVTYPAFYSSAMQKKSRYQNHEQSYETDLEPIYSAQPLLKHSQMMVPAPVPKPPAISLLSLIFIQPFDAT
jgi:hypothetical protein